MSSILKARFVEVIPNPEMENDAPGQQSITQRQAEEKKSGAAKKAELHELSPEGPHPADAGSQGSDAAQDINHPANYVDELGQTLFGQLPQSAADTQISKALEESKAITRKAEIDALRITAEAETEAKAIKRAAEEKGYEDGYAKGLEEGRAAGAEEAAATAQAEAQDSLREDAKAALSEVEYLIEALKMERMTTLHEEEEDIVQIAFEVAKKIMRQQIKVEKEAIPRMVEEVVKENEDPVKVILSEFNETLFTRIDRRMREKLKELLPGVQVLIVPNDGSAEIFQIETENGMVDAAVQEQLDRLEEAVSDPKNYEPEEI